MSSPSGPLDTLFSTKQLVQKLIIGLTLPDILEKMNHLPELSLEAAIAKQTRANHKYSLEGQSDAV